MKFQQAQIVMATMLGIMPYSVLGYSAPTASPTTAPTPVPTSDNTLPIAMNQLIVVKAGDSAVVKLKGYNTKSASVSDILSTILALSICFVFLSYPRKYSRNFTFSSSVNIQGSIHT
jgi:hypothetical protein